MNGRTGRPSRSSSTSRSWLPGAPRTSSGSGRTSPPARSARAPPSTNATRRTAPPRSASSSIIASPPARASSRSPSCSRRSQPCSTGGASGGAAWRSAPWARWRSRTASSGSCDPGAGGARLIRRSAALDAALHEVRPLVLVAVPVREEGRRGPGALVVRLVALAVEPRVAVGIGRRLARLVAGEVLEVLRRRPAEPLAAPAAGIWHRGVLDVRAGVAEVRVVRAEGQVRPPAGVVDAEGRVGGGREEDLVDRARVEPDLADRLDDLALQRGVGHVRRRRRVVDPVSARQAGQLHAAAEVVVLRDDVVLGVGPELREVVDERPRERARRAVRAPGRR